MDSDDKKITQLTEVTSLSDSDLFVVSINVGTAPVTRRIKKSNAVPASSGGGSNSICDGRLTLETGVPVSTTDQTAKTTVYFTPYIGNKIALYDGSSAWDVIEFTQLSVAVPATTSTPFDVFCYNNAGTATLETVNWTNDTTRATALTYQNGVYVKSGATTRRYLGTCRTTGTSGQCEDSTARRFVWNYYNRISKSLLAVDTTNTWTYTTATWRAANANTTDGVGRVALVIGIAEGVNVTAFANAQFYNTSAGAGVGAGIGFDITNDNSCVVKSFIDSLTTYQAFTAVYKTTAAAGYHFLQRVEYSVALGTTTWAGDSGSTNKQTGMNAEVIG